MSASSAVKNGLGPIARMEQGPLRRYLGVEGGVLLRGGPFTRLNATNPTFRRFNNALVLAPLWKWGLAIVPLMGVFTGVPAVENLDVNTSIGEAHDAATGGASRRAQQTAQPRPLTSTGAAPSVCAALATTGAIWAYYSTLVRPKSAETRRQPLQAPLSVPVLLVAAPC